MSSEITYEELEAELERLGARERAVRPRPEVPPEPGTFTASELVAATGRSRRWVAERLRLAIREGLVEAVRRRAIDISGRATLVPAYRFRKKPPEWAKGAAKGRGKRRGR